MKITKEVQAQARRLMKLCLTADGQLQEETVRCVAGEITRRKPRHGVELLTAFTELVRMEVDRHTATVVSAVPLTAEEQTSIRAKLDARTPGLRYVWKVEPELLGGIRVRTGDRVTDASLRARIACLTHLSA